MNQVPNMAGVPCNDGDLDQSVRPPPDPPVKVCPLLSRCHLTPSPQNPNKWRNRAVVPKTAPAMPVNLPPCKQPANYMGFEPHLHPDQLPASVLGQGSLIHEMSRKEKLKGKTPTRSRAKSAPPPASGSKARRKAAPSSSGPGTVPKAASTSRPPSTDPGDGAFGVELVVFRGVLGAMSVSSLEYARLQHRIFLNDSLVDYSTSIFYSRLDQATASTIHLFPSNFYLALSGMRASGKQLRREADEGLPVVEMRHKRVVKRTKDVDLFAQNAVIFPVCLDQPEHWFVVVALLNCQEPAVVLLDSWRGDREEVMTMVVQYLEEEARQRGREVPLLRTIWPMVPQQPDGFNCGIFSLMFIERILLNPASFAARARQDQLDDWFLPCALSGQRTHWAEDIRRRAAQQAPRRPRRFPALQFEPPGQLQGLGCMQNLARCCFVVAPLLLMIRCEFDQHLDQAAVLSPAQEALVNVLDVVAAARRDPTNPPMSPGPFVVALNGLGLTQFKYKESIEDSMELLETAIKGLHLAPGYLVTHEEVGTCPTCTLVNRQVELLFFGSCYPSSEGDCLPLAAPSPGEPARQPGVPCLPGHQGDHHRGPSHRHQTGLSWLQGLCALHGGVLRWWV